MLTKVAYSKRFFASKLKVTGNVVDIDGDEMTRIIWKWIKDKVSHYIYLHFISLIFLFR